MQVEDATQTDAPKTEERELTERELAMEAIAVQRENDDQEGQDGQESQPQGQVERQLSDDAALSQDSLDKIKVKVKIDGVESEVTVAEMQRQFQKNGAAERRLEEATRLLSEAREAASRQNSAGPTQAPADNNQGAAPGDSDERKEFLAALFDGDEAKALEVMGKMGIGRGNSTQNPADLVKNLVPAIKQQLVYDSALEQFKEEFSDIVANPYLADMADGFLDAEVAAGTPIDKALSAAGRKTRDWARSQITPTPTDPTPTAARNTKLERKANVDRIPALNSKATIVDEPLQTNSEVIAEMRRSRGLE